MCCLSIINLLLVIVIKAIIDKSNFCNTVVSVIRVVFIIVNLEFVGKLMLVRLFNLKNTIRNFFKTCHGI